MTSLDFATLTRDFDALKKQWADVAGATGSRLNITADGSSASTHLASRVLRLRKIMVQVQGVGAVRRVAASEYPVVWPAVSQYCCNLGFLVSTEGYAVVYHGDCACLDGYRTHPDRFTALMIGDNGVYYQVKGAPVFRSDGELVRLQASNAALVKFEIPADRRLQVLPIAQEIKVGEPVFALGTNQTQWVVSPGHILAEGTNKTTIVTDCECFHGFCGAALANAAGEVVGFGAWIEYEARQKGKPPMRRFGLGKFDRLSYLLEDIVDTL